VKHRLVQSGLCELLIGQLDKHPANPSEEENAEYDLIGRVLANILTGGTLEAREVFNYFCILSRESVWSIFQLF